MTPNIGHNIRQVFKKKRQNFGDKRRHIKNYGHGKPAQFTHGKNKYIMRLEKVTTL
jgi:hypothetical protein